MSAHPHHAPPTPVDSAPLSDKCILSFLADGTIAFIDEPFDLLISNDSVESDDKDFPPPLRIYLPGTEPSLLISELNPECPDIAFGLCGLGIGIPRPRFSSILELLTIDACCDFSFKSSYQLSVYAHAAKELDAITIDEAVLKVFAQLRE